LIFIHEFHLKIGVGVNIQMNIIQNGIISFSHIIT